MNGNSGWGAALALLVTFGPPAWAESAKPTGKPRIVFEENFCRPGEEILDHTGGCSDNRVFVDEADACLDRLQSVADRLGKGMKTGFSKDEIEKQTGKLGASHEDYVYASQTLGDLSRLTDQVMDEVDSYADYVNLPEDTLNDEITGGDEEGYAEMHPCYSETRDSLDEILDDLEDMKQEFDDAKKVADAAAATSSTRKANLDEQAVTAGGARPVAGTRGQGAGKVPAGKSRNGGSDITGVKEDRQKANKK
jgi:hypothetical protein